MSNRKAKETAEPLPVRHPESGRRYSLAELEDLAREGDPWAMTKTDDWDRHFSNEYTVAMSEHCPDPDCDLCGEPATFCYGDDYELLEIDHGGWAHPPAAERQAKAS